MLKVVFTVNSYLPWREIYRADILRYSNDSKQHVIGYCLNAVPAFHGQWYRLLLAHYFDAIINLFQETLHNCHAQSAILSSFDVFIIFLKQPVCDGSNGYRNEKLLYDGLCNHPGAILLFISQHLPMGELR